jgi:pyruvate,orthophosphate dikinase
VRGCRLGLLFPDIYDMQVRAIFLAAGQCELAGVSVLPEIMIPLVGVPAELSVLRQRILDREAELRRLSGFKGRVLIGTMIEVPRAALSAAAIAAHADSSFGTNDLTQMGLGLSRDDTGPVIASYVERGIYERDLFASIDGRHRTLVQFARRGAARSRTSRLACAASMAGPASIRFFDRSLDYYGYRLGAVARRLRRQRGGDPRRCAVRFHLARAPDYVGELLARPARCAPVHRKRRGGAGPAQDHAADRSTTSGARDA